MRTQTAVAEARGEADDPVVAAITRRSGGLEIRPPRVLFKGEAGGGLGVLGPSGATRGRLIGVVGIGPMEIEEPADGVAGGALIGGEVPGTSCVGT